MWIHMTLSILKLILSTLRLPSRYFGIIIAVDDGSISCYVENLYIEFS